MDKKLQKIISLVFFSLFLLVPLILFPKTSEIFEFNKMVFVYGITVTVTGIWAIRMVLAKKIIFRRTLLDIPLLIFISSQILSTVFSIDPRTSLLGYYSRFHGGLLSTFSYSLLYWAFVSNMDRKSTYKSILLLFYSTLLSSIWGIFEHFGHSFSCLIFPDFKVFDVSCWVQDVQTRIFSSFGQPNWLAAWLTALLPLVWAFIINSGVNSNEETAKIRTLKTISYILLSFVFFSTLLFTKSRSGLLGIFIAFSIFSILELITYAKVNRGPLRLKFTQLFSIPGLTVLGFSLLIPILIFGTPWTSSLGEYLKSKTIVSNIQPGKNAGPALEVGGGTESGKIRGIVWRGAIDIWKNYPIFGSGVETFAFSYYLFKPVEHNMTSEWDYLYNKAHNEYLNFAATTGIVGLLSYLFLIASSLFLIYRQSLPKLKALVLKETGKITKKTPVDIVVIDVNHIAIALVSGYVSILVTNFFGFSVVPVAVLFFLFPAIAVSFDEDYRETEAGQSKINNSQKIIAAIVLIVAGNLLLAVFRYWHTDYLYSLGKNESDAGEYDMARQTLLDVVKREPKEAIYWDELADASFSLSVNYSKSGNNDLAKTLAQSAIAESNQAMLLSPSNVNIKRKTASRLVSLSALDESYINSSKLVLEDAIKLAPTDPKLFYNLAYSDLRTGDYNNAITYMKKAVELKPDYEKARYALALMYIDVKENDKAKEQLKYILEKINPGNIDAKRELDELGT